jgi:hypothetical protein
VARPSILVSLPLTAETALSNTWSVDIPSPALRAACWLPAISALDRLLIIDAAVLVFVLSPEAIAFIKSPTRLYAPFTTYEP